MFNAKKSLLGITAAVAIAASNASIAEEHVVGTAVTKWLPMIVMAQPGDTIKWTNMAGHDTTSLANMIPEGAEQWHSQMGEQFAVTLETEGVYVYKCTPHASMGMVGVIVVGNPTNLDAIKAAAEDPADAPKGMVKRVLRKLDQELGNS